MRERLRSRLMRAWPIPLCIAALLVAPTAASAAPKSPQCDTRVNDTPSELVECINTQDLMGHLQAFQDIANANPGPDGMPSRNSGEPGYKASVDYVAKVMKDAGYTVTIQPYKFFYFAFANRPALSEVSPTARDFGLATEWNPAQSIGTTKADIQPAGGIVVPPT